MKAVLIPFDGGEPIPITKDVTVVGRREYCDIQIDHPSLSKRHCVLVKTDGLLVIRDLITTNGTKVKGQKIRWAALLPDDKISMGSIKFRVYLGPDDVPIPTEAGGPGKNGAAKGRDGRSAPRAPKSPEPRSRPVPRPAAEDDDLPIILDEGAWASAMRSDSEEEIIELE